MKIYHFSVAGLITFYSFMSFALCTKTTSANLRAKPSAKARLTWTVGKYTPFILHSQKRGWLRVEDMDGAKHWLYQPLSTQSYKCLSVKVNRAAARKGPGTQHSRTSFGFVDRYTPLKRLEKRGSWYNVEDQFGRKFWVSASVVWRPLKVMKVDY